jgi:hypothetical protein
LDKDAVVTVTRKGSFMAGEEIFIKNGFEVVDKIKPDFQLLFKRLTDNVIKPKFKHNSIERYSKYKKYLVILRADQCQYTVKNVEEIIALAKKKYNLTTKLININNYREAQKNPCPFGTFGIIFKGKIIAYHPISKGRFENIMDKI